MRKVFVIAAREYRASVRTKAFLISLIVMPILMCGSVVVQILIRKADEAKEKSYAVLDHTPDHTLFNILEAEAEKRNTLAQHQDPKSKRKAPKGLIKLVFVPPEDDLDAQRLALSGKVEQGEFQGFVEIGANVFAIPEQRVLPDDARDQDAIRFRSDKPQAIAEFAPWAELILLRAVEQQRLVQLEVDAGKVHKAQQGVPMGHTGLAHFKDGKIEFTSEERQIANIIAPAALIALMFMMIMIGASPAMQSVLEEKMARIAEVLLGSVRPFDLMLGKLIGMVAVSLTVAVVYLGGAYVVAYQYGFTDFLSPQLLTWFFIFQVMAVLMYGSLFIAIGAAANDMKETQSLLLPVMLIACLPMFVLGAIITDPNSTFATICSFVPTATPMLMIARIAVPPGVPWWQPVLGVVGVLAATSACVYAAGRIFRVGILMQGKGVRIGDLVKWVVRG
jgi:ABC-2 type transport system permease protein